MSQYENFGLRVSTDPAKHDLELLCLLCGEHLCDAEHGDTIAVLMGVASDHCCNNTIRCAGCGLRRQDIEEPATGDLCGCAFMLDDMEADE